VEEAHLQTPVALGTRHQHRQAKETMVELGLLTQALTPQVVVVAVVVLLAVMLHQLLLELVEMDLQVL
jgi:hypothetical protein